MPAGRDEPPGISVVVPLFRNADTVAELGGRLGAVLAGERLGFELILVDDGSPDATLAEAERLAVADPRVGVVALERNVGQQRAVLAGLAHARGARVVVLDGDLQDPPEAIPALLARAREGFDAVFAGRRGRYQSLHRTATSWLYKLAQHAVSGVPRDAGMFVVLSRRLVERVLEFGGGRLTLPTVIGLAGLPCASVPVLRPRRPRGRSSYSSRRRLAVGAANLLAAVRWRLLPAARAAAPPAPRVAKRLGACAPRVGA